MLTALLPEVGANLFYLGLLYPTMDDGLYHRRFVIREAHIHQVLLRKLLGECIQIADVTL